MRVFWLFFVLLALAALQFHGPLGGGNDDVRHAQALQTQSLAARVADLYLAWSGRVAVDALSALVVPHVWLWRLLNAGMLALLFWSMAALLRAERDLRVLLFLVAAFFLLDGVMVAEAVWWMTGSLAYLWPGALGAFALLPFARPELSARVFLLTIPAAAYASFQEQALALLVGFQCILGWHLLRRREAGRWHGVQLAVTLVCGAVLVLSPGNLRRYNAFLEHWFPEYGRLDLLGRLFSGMQLALGHVFGGGAGWALGFLLAGLLCWSAWSRRRPWRERAVASVPVLVLLAPRMFAHVFPASIVGDVHTAPMPSIQTWLDYSGAAGGARFADFWIGNPVHAAAPALYATFASLLATAGALAWALWMTFRGRRGEHRPAALAVLAWLAALAATTAVGLTPSLYYSSQRIYFMQELLTMGLAAAVFMRVLGRPEG